VNDIKNHRYFAKVSFSDIERKQIAAPFIPKVKGDDDTSNFCKVDDSNSDAVPAQASLDPFLQWS
jgi:hypothetical protein